jgi:hypothetical protein
LNLLIQDDQSATQVQTTLNAAVESYLRAKKLFRGTRNEYSSTLRRWEQWGGGTPIEHLRRKDIREFLDWVYALIKGFEGECPCCRRRFADA